MDITDQRQEWLREYVMEALKKRVIDEAKINNETMQDIINELKGEMHAMPFKNAKGTFPLKKHKGGVETHGLMGDSISIVDRIEIDHRSETLRAKTKKPTTFLSVLGQCDLHYVKNGMKIVHKLKPGNSKRVESGTPFVFSSNGARCRIFLITEEK